MVSVVHDALRRPLKEEEEEEEEEEGSGRRLIYLGNSSGLPLVSWEGGARACACALACIDGITPFFCV